MKHSDSTEMDRLLRRHARRGGETMRDINDLHGDSGASAKHMDADEMSAYAEGALPEAARTRYVAHLADCDACRKLVTNLTLATGVAAKERAHMAIADASPSKSWREWLAALFSPPVLRYGVPALVLLAVIVVAFVATRTQRDSQFTARNETGTNQASRPVEAANANMPALTTTDTTAENHSNSNVITLGENQQTSASSNSATGTATAPVNKLPADQDSPAAPQTSTSQTTDQTPGAATREQEGVIARKDDATNTKPASPPPPSPEATPEFRIEGGRDKREAQKKASGERDEEKIANQPSPSTAGVTPAQNEIAVDGTTASKSEGMSDRTNRSRRSVFGAAKTTAPSTATPKERAAETQSVAGRHFRRQGNAWVDTAYKSSRSLTNVARGSEQYRALVADEPGLRTIAEQLGGEVIVVWKSRAYRFY